MGSGCYKNKKRDLLVVGNQCENNCFSQHGGCASAQDEMIKDSLMCELRPEFEAPLIPDALNRITQAVTESTKKGKSIFLYTPDMFNDFYFKEILLNLPENPEAYIAINGCVKTFLQKVDWQDLKRKGICEIWLGVESGNKELRQIYNKPEFENQALVEVTEKGRDIGINICWFLVDGVEDTKETQLETYMLMKEAQPFRFHMSTLDFH